MKWGRPTNYHGSRTYRSDDIAVGQFSLALAWLANMARKLLKSGARSSSSTVLLADGERGFSMLGTSDRRAPRDKAAECPFPTKPAIADNDRRVFP